MRGTASKHILRLISRVLDDCAVWVLPPLLLTVLEMFVTPLMLINKEQKMFKAKFILDAVSVSVSYKRIGGRQMVFIAFMCWQMLHLFVCVLNIYMCIVNKCVTRVLTLHLMSMLLIYERNGDHDDNNDLFNPIEVLTCGSTFLHIQTCVHVKRALLKGCYCFKTNQD